MLMLMKVVLSYCHQFHAMKLCSIVGLLSRFSREHKFNAYGNAKGCIFHFLIFRLLIMILFWYVLIWSLIGSNVLILRHLTCAFILDTRLVGSACTSWSLLSCYVYGNTKTWLLVVNREKFEYELLIGDSFGFCHDSCVNIKAHWSVWYLSWLVLKRLLKGCWPSYIVASQGRILLDHPCTSLTPKLPSLDLEKSLVKLPTFSETYVLNMGYQILKWITDWG